MDARVAAGEKLPLAGVPLAVKDNIWIAGRQTTCASRILAGFRPPGDSTVAARLREAGAVFVGRANMDEFAMGSSTENSSSHVTRNPWDPERIPGGSSGGSAAAVAARLRARRASARTRAARSGSPRRAAASWASSRPTAACRATAWSPSPLRSTRSGRSARSVADAARLYRVIAGPDPLDSTTSQRDPGDPEAALARGVRGMRVGFLEEAQVEGLDPEVAANLERRRGISSATRGRPSCRSRCRAPRSPSRSTTSWPAPRRPRTWRGSTACGTVRARRRRTSLALYVESRTAGFGAEVKRRILLGTFALASGYYEAYYGRAHADARSCCATISPARSRLRT